MINMFLTFLAIFILIKKITKGRHGKSEYLIVIIIISIFQILISYMPYFFSLYLFNYPLQPYILLLFFCLNIHISVKRVNDSVISENDKYFVYFTPVSTFILYMGRYFLTFFIPFNFYEPGPIYLILLILLNIIPVINLYFKEYDIDIKNTDIPINYKRKFYNLYKDKFLIEIKDDYIYVNDFQFSLKHDTNTYKITSYKDIDNENLLVKYFKEKGIRMLCFHYKNFYYELTDEEYNTMIADVKTMRNVIYIDYPYIVINNKSIYIRNDGLKYSVVLLKEDQEELRSVIYFIKNISQRIDNKEYICYKGIKKDDIIEWVKKCV